MDIKEIRAHLKSNRGHVGRHILLAFAFLRGMPYRRLELVTREDNKPRLGLLYKTIEGAIPTDNNHPRLTELKAWLSVPATGEMLDQAKQARDRVIERKRLHAEAVRGARASVSHHAA